MKSRLVAAVSALALVVPTLAHADKPTPPGQISGLQIAVGDCLSTDNPPARTKPAQGTNKGIVDELAKAAITEGANYIGKALTEAGKARTLTASGTRNLKAPASGLGNCVIVVRGRFDATGAVTPAWTAPHPWNPDLAAKLVERGIVSVDAPDFLFEGKIVQSDDASSFTIRPATISYGQPIGEKVSAGQERHVALFFAFTGPGVKVTADSAPATNVVIGKIATATGFKFAPPPADQSSPFEPIWFSVSSDAKKPVTINVVESDTRDERAFLTFLGKVLSTDKVKGEIASTAQQVLIPSVAAQNEATERALTVTTNADLNGKMAAAKTAVLACSVATGDANIVATGKDAFTALSNYLAADVKAPAPTEAIDEATIAKIDSRLAPAAIKQGCVDILPGLKMG
jgi:hypothetical protein